MSTDQLKNLADIPVEQRNAIASDFVWPANPGEAHVCVWKNDKQAAASITIDDNTRPDHDWWFEQGERTGFRFTWFVVTQGIVDGGNAKFKGTWADFQRLIDGGHDVQSHAATHRSKKANWPADKDYAVAIEHLQANLTGTRPLTLAYPGGGLPNDHSAAAEYYAGARGTKGVLNPASPDYINTNSVSGSHAYNRPKGEKGDWASLVAALDPSSAELWRGWYCVHFHGVAYNAKWREEVMPHTLGLLDYLKQNENLFWVAPFREVILYGQERDTATLTVTQNTPEQISFTLADRMLDEWYDFPLTIKVRLPDSWAEVHATQNEALIDAAVVHHEGGAFAMVQAVPDQGVVVLTPRPATNPK